VASLAPLRASLGRWISNDPEDQVLPWLYRALIVATLAVLILDYADFEPAAREKTGPEPSIEQPSAQPLPGATRESGKRRPAPPRETVARLREAMTFELTSDGRLLAIGTIVPGSATAFAAEIAKRGSYVKTVVLQSPGGSLRDALAMGRLIREKKYATEVEANRYCASSCPLVFAGGVERRAGANAAIGVHRVSAVGEHDISGAAGMENGQHISAACQKYLREMGIDLEVWVHAMETPREQLYYFTSDELATFRLATQIENRKASGSAKT
jgi:hypothetical protein